MGACISEVLSPLVGDNDRVWSLRYYRKLNDWKLAASYSLLHFIQTQVGFLKVEVVTIFVGVLMEVGSLTFNLFIISFEM